LRRYLKARRHGLKAPNTIVIGAAACGEGNPAWFQSDGSLVPFGYFKQLRKLSAAVAGQNPHLGARAQRGRGTTPALPARTRRLPAIAVGAFDQRGLAPRSHQATDTPERVDAGSIDRVVEFGLLLVDAIDAYLGSRPAPAAPEKASATPA
jgi:hypothetical protein